MPTTVAGDRIFAVISHLRRRGCATTLNLLDLVVVGDFIVRKEWYTTEELIGHCQRSTDRHAVRAVRAAGYVRAEVDSPMETRLRMLLVLAGLPEPTVNFRIRDDWGHVVRRFDLSYPGLRLIIEYDGRQHAEDAKQYDSDIERREELGREKWRIIVITAKGIYREPERTLARVRTALVEQGATGLPARLSDAWRAHFPGFAGSQGGS